MRDRRRVRRGWVLAISGIAAVSAGAMALAPMVVGTRPGPQDLSFLNVSESGADHARDHRAASPATRRRAVARLRSCADAGWRARNAAFCPSGFGPAGGQRTLAVTSAGKWGPKLRIPTNAIHAVVMRTGKVLWFSQPKYPAENGDKIGGTAHVWDPETLTSISVPPPKIRYPTTNGAMRLRPANLWCAGQVVLPDGRVLVVGGNLKYNTKTTRGAGNGFRGAPWVMTFDPITQRWTRYKDMPHGRWYPTLTLLPDGRVLIVGGWDETGGIANPPDPGGTPLMLNNQDIEVFDPATPPGGQATTVVSKIPPNGPGQPTPYPNHEDIGLYPHMFVLPSTTALGAGGTKVLVAGPLVYDSAVIDTSTWIWTDVVKQPDTGQPRLSQGRAWATAWLEPGGPNGSQRVVLQGGADSGGTAPAGGTAPPPSTTAEVLDLNNPAAAWQLGAAPSLITPRAHYNTVLLPDGSLLASGGGYGRKNGSLYADPVYSTELLPPGGAGGWRSVGNQADARTYHSTAVLLPDGRVLSAGDDRDIAPVHIPLNKRTAQAYSPPYLFAGARPRVTFSPARVRYNAPFRVAVKGDPATIARAVLMRPGAVTHAADMAQQMIELPVSAQPDGLTLTSPLDASVAPPGYYMLFVLNGRGAASAASWVRIDPAAADAPALPPPDRSRPRVSVPSLTASAAARTVTVKLRVRSGEEGSMRLRLARSGAGASVTLAPSWRSDISLSAGRVQAFAVPASVGAGPPPPRVSVTLTVSDRSGNPTTVRRAVRLSR